MNLLYLLGMYPAFLPAQIPAFSARLTTIAQIPVPAGYERVAAKPGSFGAYLQQLPLRKDRTVFLYTGRPKENQSLHYAVIDISTGSKDLQQCADLVMRLRAEYFFQKEMFDSIRFLKGDKTFFRYTDRRGKCKLEQHECLMEFMEQVFMYCGTIAWRSS
jgi:hypothetical protein